MMATRNEAGTFEGDERLDKLHRVLLMMLKDFAALCERESLTWIAMYGTAIGALRHDGFIPWDDDLDICMPRSDLERLTTLINGRDAQAGAETTPASLTALRKKYCIVNAQTHVGYPMMTYRLMLKGTEFRDSALATMDFPSGIFLDLFPLDTLAEDERERKRQIWRAWLWNKLAIAKLTANPYVGGKGIASCALRTGSAVARKVLNFPGICRINPNEHARAWLLRYDNAHTNARDGASPHYLGYPCDTNRFWDIYEASELFPVRWVSFEDTQIPLARRAEDLLSKLYGNWQTPPPNDARKAHYPDILNFGDYENM